MARIAFIAPDLAQNSVYPPWQFTQAMRAGGHEVMLAGQSSGPRWTPLAGELANAAELPGRWAGLPRCRSALALVRAGGVQAVYPFKAMPTSLGVAWRVREATGVPLILHLDDWDAGFLAGAHPLRRAWWGFKDLNRPDGDFWLRWMERRVGAADAVTVSSRALQRRFGGTVVRQGVDVRRFAPASHPRAEARERIGAGEHEPMILFLGTPRLHKGLGHLAALGDLSGAVWFVGASLESLADAGVPEPLLLRSRTVGPVPFTESAWYLAACDVFVVPQVRTPFAEHQLPAKLLHAMALGCAVVATDVGDARELLGGEPAAGVVVPPEEPQALAAAVRDLLSAPGRAAALGAEARRRAEEGLGWDAVRNEVESVLRTVGVHG